MRWFAIANQPLLIDEQRAGHRDAEKAADAEPQTNAGCARANVDTCSAATTRDRRCRTEWRSTDADANVVV